MMLVFVVCRVSVLLGFVGMLIVWVLVVVVFIMLFGWLLM